MVSRDRRRHGPKTEKEDDNPKPNRKSIDQDAKDTRKMERSPNELISLAGIVRYVGRFADSTCTPAPEEKALCNYIRGVKTADAEGDDVVEGGGGADVDEADETGDEGCYNDGEEWDCGFGFNLRGRISQDV